MNLLKKVYLTIEGYQMIRPGETVLCAVSGGPDSVAMFHILRELSEVPQPAWKLHVAHVHHGLRGAAADEDEAFVRELAGKAGIPFHSTRVDVRGLQKKERISMEEAARKLRHEFLRKTALQVGAQKIALAHNMDDQAETILHRILRGTGLRGLKGMAPIRLVSKRHDLFTVRPLIETERREIEDFLKARKAAYRTDLTNLDTTITRNRIRHKLIPLMESEFNPRVKLALVKLGQTAASFYLFLRELSRDFYENVRMLSGEGEVCLSVEEFGKLPPAIQTLIIDRSLQDLLGRVPHLNFEHYLRIIGLCGEQAFQKAVCLPRGLEARREGYILKIAPSPEPPPPLRFSPRKLDVQIETEIQEGRIVGFKDFIRSKDFSEEAVDLDRLKGPLTVRLRAKGDQFVPLGSRHAVKLKKFFIDHKVPRALRDRIPLVSDGARIIWVVGYRISEDVKITESTRRVLRMRVRRIEAPEPAS